MKKEKDKKQMEPATIPVSAVKELIVQYEYTQKEYDRDEEYDKGYMVEGFISDLKKLIS